MGGILRSKLTSISAGMTLYAIPPFTMVMFTVVTSPSVKHSLVFNLQFTDILEQCHYIAIKRKHDIPNQSKVKTQDHNVRSNFNPILIHG